MIKIAPSILSADFTQLGRSLDSVKNADLIHFDVMDGAFVPNISFGLPVLKAVREYTDAMLDVHLMIEKPERYIDDFAAAGADLISVHLEADSPRGIRRALDAMDAGWREESGGSAAHHQLPTPFCPIWRSWIWCWS